MKRINGIYQKIGGRVKIPNNILKIIFLIVGFGIVAGACSFPLSLLVKPENVHAAACTWQGDTNPAVWNDLAHWSCGHVPNNADTVTFASSNTNSATLDANVDVLGFSITAGYTGIITQNAGVTVTVGTSNYSQVAGTFTGGDSAITFNGTFSLTNAAGTFTATTGTTTFTKAYTHTAGTFNHNVGTVVYGGTTAYTVDVNANETYTNLQFNSTNASIITLGASDNLIVLGTLTMVNGYTNVGTINPRGATDIQATFDGGSTVLTIDANATADITIPDGATAPGINISNAARTVGFAAGATAGIGPFTMTNGVFNCSDTQTTFNGAFTHTVAAGTFTCTSGTAVFGGNVGANFTVDVNSTETFNNLTMNSASTRTMTIASGDTLVANGTVTLTKGAINTGTISAKVGATVNGLSGGSATLNLSSTAADQTLTWSSGTLCGLSINKTGYIATISGNLSAGALTVTAGTLNAGATTNTFSGAVTINGGVLSATTGTMSVAGNWALTSGTFTHNNGTVAFNAASGTQTVNSGGQNFYNVNHNAAGTAQLATNHFTVSNNFNNSSGTFDLNSKNLTVSATFTNSATLKLTGTETVSTPTLNTNSIVEYSATSGTRNIMNWTYTNATIKINGNGGTYTLPGAISCVAINVTIGTLQQGANTITIGASGFTQSGGTFTAGASNITNSGAVVISGGVYTGSSGNMANSGNFTLAGGTFTQSTGTVSAVDYSQTGGTYNGGSNTSTFSGTFTLTSGTFNQNTSVLSATDFNQYAGTFNGGSVAITATGNFTLSGGTFVSTSNILTVAGNWDDCGGVFTHSSGTIVLNNSATKTFSTFGSNTYNNITHSGAGQTSVSMWKYRRLITIDHTKIPDVAVPSTTYANFPVLISLSGLSNINANGTDIRFTGSDGATLLPRQIESYSGGALLAWVKVTLTKDAGDSSDDTFYMYYGNTAATEPAASSIYGSQNVWDINYKGVWLSNDNAVNTTVRESTSNANTGTAQQNTSVLATTGKNDGALIYNGSSDYITTNKALSTFMSASDGSISVWVYPNGTQSGTGCTNGSGNGIVVDSDNSGSGGGYIWLGLDQNGACAGGHDGSNKYVSTSYTINQWMHLEWVHTGGVLSLYKNGTFINSVALGNISGVTHIVDFDNGYSQLKNFKGTIDDIRISNIARSANWIAAEYANQNSPSTFVTKGDEVASPLVSATVSGNLTNSGGTLDLATLTLNLAGNLNSTGGAITAGTSTVTLNGSATQTITSASQSFYNLTITNASVAGVTFADSAIVTGTFTDITASSKLTFHALSTYAFANINLNGQALGTKIVMVSSDPANPDLPSRQWYFNVTQVGPSATYVNVTDSDALGGNAITPITSTNGGNNENWLFNVAPNSPSSLLQKKVTGGATLATGDWTNETQVEFTATASDTDNPDTLYLCVEKDVVSTAFSSTNGGDLCGSGVAYSGTPVTVSVTITGLTDTAEYHWQVQVKDAAAAYSSFVTYGGNTENPPTNPAARDFGVDETAPSGGTIYDGSDGVDDSYNSGSLSALSAYWTSAEPNFDVSGKAASNVYQYAIGTTAGGTDTKTWTATGNSGADSFIDASGLTLRTGQSYYFSVKATDAAGNASIAINSNGQAAAPTLTFSYASGGAIAFNDLNSGNSYTDSTKTTVLRTSTNAYSGYIIKARALDKLRHTGNLSSYIDHYVSPNSAPTVWSGIGFGYTTSDDNLSGGTADRFTNGGPKYAGWTETGPGDPVADNQNPTHIQITNDDFTIAYRVSGNATTVAGTYQTTIIYTCIPQY